MRTSARTSPPTSSPSPRPFRQSSSPPAAPALSSPVAPASLSPTPTAQVRSRSPSPNYFGQVADPGADASSPLPGYNWSPPSTSVQPFATALQRHASLDSNPDLQTRRPSDSIHPRPSSLLGSQPAVRATDDATVAITPAARARLPAQPAGRPGDLSLASLLSQKSALSDKVSNDRRSSYSHFTPMSSISLNSNRLESHSSPRAAVDSNPMARKVPLASPAINSHSGLSGFRRTVLTRSEDRDPRLSVMLNRPEAPSPRPTCHQRAESVPVPADAAPLIITPARLASLLEQDQHEPVLLLDVRSSQNYAQSRVRGAINLCIPTTLLKRATFNVHKLQQTFQLQADRDVFSRWRTASFLVVYDSHTSEQRDAVTATNMIKKFIAEGYAGQPAILRGGFNLFRDSYPALIEVADTSPAARPPSSPDPSAGPLVVGGISLPSSNYPAEPFFSSIRQNTELADGVGQLEISRPPGLDPGTLPRWLRDACAASDHGKLVATNFLRIEVSEQSRMRAAFAPVGPSASQPGRVKIAGLERGGKNRYRDILPFEHARVRLQGKPEGACDYVNASFLTASRSNKLYIATQGPLPATFEDFWTVIWEQNVRVIVMLTAESEGGQLKCHPYWKAREYGPIRLQPVSEKKISLDLDPSHPTLASVWVDPGRRRANTLNGLDTASPSTGTLPTDADLDSPFVTIRRFAISHSSHPFASLREVTQLHFSSWPDFGAPARPSYLLALIELANYMQQTAQPTETESRPRPMLVHCSAGCGRTGTFCTIDSVIDMLKRQQNAAAHRPSATTTTLTTATPRDHDRDVRMTDAAAAPSFSFAATSLSSSPPASSFTPSIAAIDLSWLADDSTDLIDGTVHEFRGQRLSMVQSLKQFVLCYESVLDWVWRAQGGVQIQPAVHAAADDNTPTAPAAAATTATAAAVVPAGRGRTRGGSLHTGRE